MVHRIFLVRARPDLAPAAAQGHWRAHHSGVFARTPGLLGYVQDRPLEEAWAALRYQVCSETWFASDPDERAAFATDHYREQVSRDEAGFLDRDSVWRGRILGAELLAAGPRGRYRVLAFGAERVPEAPRVEALALDRDPPAGGPRRLVSAWLDDRERAREIAAASDGLALAVEPVAVVWPPDAEWP